VKKIAVIAPTYLPARRANTIQVLKMSQAIVGLGHLVQVFVPGKAPDGDAWEMLESLYGLRERFEVTWVPVNSRWRSYDFGLKAVRLARQWDASLVYTRHPQAAAIASQTGVPTILEVHDLPQGVFGPRLFRLFCRGRGAKRLVVITQSLARDLKEQLGVSFTSPFQLVLPDGVDLERFTDLPEPGEARQILLNQAALSGFDVARFTAGYTGHLYAGRGITLLLQLAELMPEVNFLLVGGEAADITKLRSDVREKNLRNVFVTGFVPNSNLPLYQAACDVLLMPYQRQVSASSGGDIGRYLSPMKLFEYLASQRAILSSDLPVLREILNPQIAMLLPPQDIQAWVVALKMLRDDPGQRKVMAENALAAVRQYTWDARAKQLLSFESL
jgi:glycosyltransferase involved in cell wall biosynthesis